MKKKISVEFEVPSYKVRGMWDTKKKCPWIKAIIRWEDGKAICRGVVLDSNTYKPIIVGPVYKNIDVQKALQSCDPHHCNVALNIGRVITVNYVDCRINTHKGLI